MSNLLPCLQNTQYLEVHSQELNPTIHFGMLKGGALKKIIGKEF